METAGIDEIKRLRDSGSYDYCSLHQKKESTKKGAIWTVITPNNLQKSDFVKNCNAIINDICNNVLNPGLYQLRFRKKINARAGNDYEFAVGHYKPTLQEPEQKQDQMDAEKMDMWKQLVKLQSDIELAKQENEKLKRELEEQSLDDGEQAFQSNIASIGESIKGILSEVVVPIVSRYMEQRERRTVALEAAAASGARLPVYTAPAPAFQVRPGYIPTRPQTPPPASAAASGAPSSGGSQTPPPPAKTPDEMTEQEYMDAIKHLTFDELQTYYDKIKAAGSKLELSYFLAIVKETRPDDLVPLIDQDLNKQNNDE